MVKCGISPLDIPHLSPLQMETLIYQHNKQEEQREKDEKKQNRKSRRK